MNSGSVNPTAFLNTKNHYATNTNVQFVRGDHYFQLLASAQH
jgi:hypothetical protein